MFFKDRKTSASEPRRQLPLLPLRDLVVFPSMVVPLIVGRQKSRNALGAAYRGTKEILLVAQKAGRITDPNEEDLYGVGTVATIIQMLRLPDDNLKVLVEGRSRARLGRFVETDPHLLVEVADMPDRDEPEVEIEALIRSVRSGFEQYVKLNKTLPPEMVLTINAIEQAGKLADTLVGHLGFRLEERQELLETDEPSKRLERLLKHLQAESEILQVERKIKSRVKKQMEKSQKEYYLTEQMQAIQKELGEKDEFKSELAELEQKLAEKRLHEEARDRAVRELRKLKMMSPMSAEAAVVRSYLDWILALPWDEPSAEQLDLESAAEILDQDHYGLRLIKERILEHLAVSRLVERPRGPILCFVGPPGVGKTSLARSIAACTGRSFVRQALGGVRDEAEIRGHRRTYIGALPGKIVQCMKKAGTSNPVFLLDEVDKMSSDFRGDPAAALLEVLDPEQNHAFNDHYLDLDFDLSRVMFVCTANSLQGIPEPLQDRLEIIRLPGYTEREKLAIARRHLLPKQLEANGLTTENLTVTRQAMERMVREYTRESGVRNLDRELASVCRKVAKRVVWKGVEVSVRVTSENVHQLLGVPRFTRAILEDSDQIGLVKGLAVTPWGGDTLDIEVAVVPGSGKLILTGLLGDWLKESATAAFSYVRSRSVRLGLEPDFHEKYDLHIHYPGNSLKTDGPSAGIAMATAVASALTGLPVRRDLAMTGEVSLRGRVLPIGGLKEKALAAHRAGIALVLVPAQNEKDLAEIPGPVRDALELVLVHHMDEVLDRALLWGHRKAFEGAATPEVDDDLVGIGPRPAPAEH